jgi:hypothetical protein
MSTPASRVNFSPPNTGVQRRAGIFAARTCRQVVGEPMIRAPESRAQVEVSNEWSKWLWPVSSRLTADFPPIASNTSVTAATSGVIGRCVDARPVAPPKKTSCGSRVM